MNNENTNKNANEPMPSKSIRLRVDQWEDCERLKKQLGLPSPNHFIRDAVDFYIEFLNAKMETSANTAVNAHKSQGVANVP